MTLLLALVHSAHAACALPRTLAELDTVLDGAEHAWGENPATFQESVTLAGTVLDCVNAPLPPSETGRLLRLDALAAFARRDSARAAAAFAAARGADPTLSLPEAMAGEGSPLRAIWETASPPGTIVHLRGAARGKLYVDGHDAVGVPAEHPFVFQWVDGVNATGAVTTATTLPKYPWKAHPARDPLLVGAGVAAVASGVLYGLAWSSHEAAGNAGSLSELDTAEAENHTFVYASAGAGGVAVLALTGAVVVWKW